MNLLWGIDLGGTKIEAVAYDYDRGKALERLRLPTEREKGADHIINQISKLINQLQNSVGLKPRRVGVGLPGVYDPESETMVRGNTECLAGYPIKKVLESRIGAEFFFANDANCFALAETHLGVVKELDRKPKVVFGIILGTGVGSGIVVDGHVLNGHHGIAGEWGHNILDETGDECFCGNKGCVEKFISGTALQKYYNSLTGGNISLKEIMTSESGIDEVSKQKTIERLLHYFGRAVAHIVNIIDPDVIIIGGGVGNIDLLYKEGPKEITKYIFSDKFTAKLLKPKLGDSAGVFGAAMLTLK